jgi:hypothetical protein
MINREEIRMESNVLRTILKSKRDEVTEKLIKLPEEEL